MGKVQVQVLFQNAERNIFIAGRIDINEEAIYRMREKSKI